MNTEIVAEAEATSVMITDDSSSSQPKPKGFSIYTWNINGLRTLNMTEVIRSLNCDILAVQETKISRDQLTEPVAYIDGGSSFFSYSTKRSGYSGVATYCRKDCTPVKAEEGVSGLIQAPKGEDSIGAYHELEDSEKILAKQADAEGRAVITQHLVKLPNDELKPLTIINVYCPRLRDDPTDTVNNTDMKYLFHTLVGKRGMNLVSKGSFVLIVGDLNVSHKALDVADGDDTLPSTLFREWLDYLLDSRNSHQFHDTFRVLHPTRENAFTCWRSRTNARQNNYGSRIDYILADNELLKYLDKAEIHPDIMGSDHCPASAVFHSLVIQNSSKHPALSTKFYPEFSGKQQNLKDFFTRQSVPSFPAKSQTSNPLNSIKKTTSFKQSQSKIKQTGTSKQKQMSLAHFIVKKSIKADPAVSVPECVDQEIPSSQVPVKASGCLNNENCHNREDDVKMETDTSEQPSSDLASIEFEHVLKTSKANAAQAWKQLMKAPEVPQCSGHKEPCTLRLTKKKGPNLGRKFWSCSRGDGKDSDPNANCGFFQWVVNSKP